MLRNTALAGAGLLAVCIGVVELVSSPKCEPRLTVITVLADAAAREERANFKEQPGVIFQRVKVTDGSERLEWLVYRDRQGKRTPHFQAASAHETHLRQRLADAGVGREDPLSVSSYTKWRNRLTAATDSVAISPSGLIALKTSTAPDTDSPVREETLLLRGNDYHPVSRSVTFRDAESVEIAELDYRVLDWRQTGRDWFNDLQPEPIPARQVVQHDLPIVKTVMLDPSELDLAELKARWILSTHNADTSEQIDVVRAEDAIRVEGLASTAERKRELESALESVPHVAAKLTTPEERAALQTASSTPNRVKVIESNSQASPLLEYLRNRHREADSYAQFSAKFMESAVRIGRQCHALSELEVEFAPRMPLDPLSRQAFEDLVGDHMAKLRIALIDQAGILRLVLRDDSSSSSPYRSAGSASLSKLVGQASRSLELSKELIAGRGASQRDAVLILNDLVQVNSTMIRGLDEARTDPR